MKGMINNRKGKKRIKKSMKEKITRMINNRNEKKNKKSIKEKITRMINKINEKNKKKHKRKDEKA